MRIGLGRAFGSHRRRDDRRRQTGGSDFLGGCLAPRRSARVLKESAHALLRPNLAISGSNKPRLALRISCLPVIARARSPNISAILPLASISAIIWPLL